MMKIKTIHGQTIVLSKVEAVNQIKETKVTEMRGIMNKNLKEFIGQTTFTYTIILTSGTVYEFPFTNIKYCEESRAKLIKDLKGVL